MAALLPHEDRLRPFPPENRPYSVPTTPFGMDHRGFSSQEMDQAMEQARYGLQGPDYFSDGPRYGVPMPMRPRSPFPGGRFEDDMNGYVHEMGLNDLIRRSNLAASLANHYISHRAHLAEVHPKMCSDGRFPPDFQVPRPVREIKTLDRELAQNLPARAFQVLELNKHI